MKALLSILPITLLLVGCGNTESKPDLTNTAPEKDPMEPAVEWSKLQNRNGDAYIPNTDRPYSGWAKQIYDNEQVKVLAEFTDGSVTRLRQWQENGLPMWDIRYSKGKVSLSDVPHEFFWDTNHSCKHGLTIVWYESGKKVESNYKDGKLDGFTTAWHENGQKKAVENYKDGKLVSLTAWKQNGEKCPHTDVVGGNGVGVFYNEDGTVSERDTYKDGKIVESVSYREDGTVSVRNTYSDGKTVESVSYREDGTVIERNTYKDGEIVED